MNQAIVTTSEGLEVLTFSTLRWPAIFCGWLVATGIAWLLYVLGLAVGFSAFNPSNSAAVARGLGVGTGIWVLLTWAVSLFLGGMFASWFDGKADQTVGALHGVAVWALATTVSLLLVALGFAHILQGGAAVIRGAAPTTMNGGNMSAPGTEGRARFAELPDAGTMRLQAQLTQRVAQAMTKSAPTSMPNVPATSGAAPAPAGVASPSPQISPTDMRRMADQIDRDSMRLVVLDLVAGKTEDAKITLAATTSLSQADIDQILQGMSGQTERYKAELQTTADNVARYTSRALWMIFFSSIIALLTAAVGGWLGAGNVHRVYHLRRYPTGGPPAIA